MTAAAYRLTHAASADVETILRASARRFGVGQRAVYAALLARSADLVGANPSRPGSRDRSDLGPSVRSFHVELAGSRRGCAAQCLYYVVEPHGVVVLRILHERMDPLLHIRPLD